MYIPAAPPVGQREEAEICVGGAGQLGDCGRSVLIVQNTNVTGASPLDAAPGLAGFAVPYSDGVRGGLSRGPPLDVHWFQRLGWRRQVGRPAAVEDCRIAEPPARHHWSQWLWRGGWMASWVTAFLAAAAGASSGGGDLEASPPYGTRGLVVMMAVGGLLLPDRPSASGRGTITA